MFDIQYAYKWFLKIKSKMDYSQKKGDATPGLLDNFCLANKLMQQHQSLQFCHEWCIFILHTSADLSSVHRTTLSSEDLENVTFFRRWWLCAGDQKGSRHQPSCPLSSSRWKQQFVTKRNFENDLAFWTQRTAVPPHGLLDVSKKHSLTFWKRLIILLGV